MIVLDTSLSTHRDVQAVRSDVDVIKTEVQQIRKNTEQNDDTAEVSLSFSVVIAVSLRVMSTEYRYVLRLLQLAYFLRLL